MGPRDYFIWQPAFTPDYSVIISNHHSLLSAVLQASQTHSTHPVVPFLIQLRELIGQPADLSSLMLVLGIVCLTKYAINQASRTAIDAGCRGERTPWLSWGFSPVNRPFPIRPVLCRAPFHNVRASTGSPSHFLSSSWISVIRTLSRNLFNCLGFTWHFYLIVSRTLSRHANFFGAISQF